MRDSRQYRPETAPSQILVLRLSSIGDVLLATPLVRALRGRYPGALLRFLVKPPYAGLLTANRHLDGVLRWPGLAQAAPPWSGPVLDLAARLRARRPLWLVDLQASPRSAAFAALLGPDRAFRHRKDYLRRALLVRAGIDRYPRPISSMAERYFVALRGLGLAPDGQGLDLRLAEPERRRAAEALGDPTGGESGVPGRPASSRIAVAPGARWATKRWPPEAFAAAARAIASERGRSVVLLGSAGDAAATKTIATFLSEAGVRRLDLAGRLSLLETAAVLERCELLLANDSGLMHVAAALQVPTVALFGSTSPQLGFAPYRAPARVLGVEGLSCRPCTHIGREACPLGHFRCMREIAPETVVRAARELLEEVVVKSLLDSDAPSNTTRPFAPSAKNPVDPSGSCQRAR